MHEQLAQRDDTAEIAQYEQDFAMPEQGQEQSLFDLHAETPLATFGGMTLKQAIDMCPVPPEMRSAAAYERVAANILTSEGVSIPERFQHLVDAPQKPESKPDQAVPKPEQPITKPKAETAVPSPHVTIERATAPTETPSAGEPELAAAPETSTDVGVGEAMGGPDELNHSETRLATPAVAPVQSKERRSAPKRPLLEPKPIEISLGRKPNPSNIPPLPEAVPAIMPIETEAAPFQEVPELITETTVEDIQQRLGEIYVSPAEEVEPGVPPIAVEPLLDEFAEPFEELSELMPAPSEIFSYELIEPMQLGVVDEVETQTETPAELLYQLLPEVIQQQLVETVQENPEAVEQINEALETLSLYAERLHVLHTNEQDDSSEAQQITEVIAEYFDQLEVTFGVELTEVVRHELIRRLAQHAAAPDTLAEEVGLPDDEGTHEFKHRSQTQDQSSQTVDWRRTGLLTSFILKRGLRIHAPVFAQ